MYNWPLNDSSFTWLDRLKICGFFLNPYNFWTQNKKVQEFEEKMAAFMGFKYAVFTSSGSTANTILAMYLRDKLKKEKSKRNIVVLPSTTWTTSCAPFIREGFKPHFIDVSLENFAMDLYALDNFLKENKDKVAAVFPTCLLGFNLDYLKLKSLKDFYPSVSFFIDQCENTFGQFDTFTNGSIKNFTCTTSTYFGHELQSVEGGFLFTNSVEEYAQFLMYRNHGMTRSLPEEIYKTPFKNNKVDSRFDFYSLGSNFRNTDIHALVGLLDFKKRYKHVAKRKRLYGIFQYSLNKDRYILPADSDFENHSWCSPFCLPIITKDDKSQSRFWQIRHYCTDNFIETRPIISGFLGYQTAYKGMMKEKDYPNSVYLHNNGIYVGLNTKLKKKQVVKLVDFLNKI